MSDPSLLEAFQQTGAGQFITQQGISLIAPEFIILMTLLLCLVKSFNAQESEQRETWAYALFGVAAAFVMLVIHFFIYMPGAGESEWLSRPVFYGMFQADLFSLAVRTLLTLGTGVVILFSRRYVEEKLPLPGEYYILLLSALLGGMFLSGAMDLIMLFVALETLGISSFALAGYQRGDLRSSEAALKYLLFGGASTAILLFGFSLLYAFSNGSTHFTEIALNTKLLSMVPAQALALSPLFPLIPVMAILILGGLAFKLSAAPFHMWTPDIYEGAPTPVTAFLSVVSKIAGFSITIRLLYVVLGSLPGWFVPLAILSILSMTIGNVVALTQRNIKRLLAYSTIAHAGYILLGVLTLNAAGLTTALFYLLTYLFMNLGAFAVAIHLGQQTGREDIASYAGLVRKRPVLTLVFSFFLLSLAGIPITAGFFAKFFLFTAVGTLGANYLWLVIVALINSTISLYYYLNIIRLMVVAEPSDAVEALPVQGGLSFPMGAAIALCTAGTLALGLWADPILRLANTSAMQLAALAQGPMVSMETPRQ